MVREKGIEPPRLAAPDPKSGVSTSFTTLAFGRKESQYIPTPFSVVDTFLWIF
jgi:hypothetical protein